MREERITWNTDSNRFCLGLLHLFYSWQRFHTLRVSVSKWKKAKEQHGQGCCFPALGYLEHMKLVQRHKSYTQARRNNMLYFCFPKRSILTVEGKQMFICFGWITGSLLSTTERQKNVFLLYLIFMLKWKMQNSIKN